MIINFSPLGGGSGSGGTANITSTGHTILVSSSSTATNVEVHVDNKTTDKNSSGEIVTRLKISAVTPSSTAVDKEYALVDKQGTEIEGSARIKLNKVNYKDGLSAITSSTGTNVYAHIDENNSEKFLTVSPAGLAITGISARTAYSSGKTICIYMNASGTNLEVHNDNKTITHNSDGVLKTDIHILSITPTADTIRNEYVLTDKEGSAITGDHIYIYKDQRLTNAYVGKMGDSVNPMTGEITSGVGETSINMVVLNQVGDYILIKANAQQFIEENEIKDGLEVVDHNLYVKIDEDSEDFLSVSSNGVLLSGVTDYVDSAVTAERNRAMSAETDLWTAVVNEIERATSAETFILSALSAETSARTISDNNIASALSAETRYRLSADTMLSSALTVERLARISGDSALTKTIIDNEKVTAAAINNLQNRFSAYTPTSGMTTINGHPITVGGNLVIEGGSGSSVVELTQAEYDALSAYTPNTTYIITDAAEVNIADYYNSAQTLSAITTKLSAYTPTSGFCKMNGTSIITHKDNVFYAPITGGVAGQPLLASGTGNAPYWGDYKFHFITQTLYDSLAVKDPESIYFIIGD